MTDLRTRIAAAIAQADQDWCSDRPLHEDMADAVIRELKLHLQPAKGHYRGTSPIGSLMSESKDLRTRIAKVLQEEKLRQHLGKNVSILKEVINSEPVPITLKTFRERQDQQPSLFDEDFEYGGCGCFVEEEGTSHA